MSKLGKKVLLCFILLLVFSIVSTTVSIFKGFLNFNSRHLENFAMMGLNVLKNDTAVQNERIETIFRTLEIDNAFLDAVKNNKPGVIKKEFSGNSANTYDYCVVVDTSGKELWKTDNFALSSYNLSGALAGNESGGIVLDSAVPMSYQYSGPIKDAYGKTIGAILIGFDYVDTSYIDRVVEQTNAHVTIFCGDVRYTTSVKDDNGNRISGTKMSDAVKAQVIDKGLTYVGKAMIQNDEYFVCYEPIFDAQGNVIGSYFAGHSTAETVKLTTNLVINTITIVLILIVLISVVTLIYFNKLVSKPMLAVNKLAAEMSQGNLNASDLSIKFGNDEIGDFAATLYDTKNKLSLYMNDMSRVLSSMAEGDFSQKTSVEFLGDFRQINTSFEQINKNLYEIIKNIDNSSEEVMLGSNQMANGSQILANGTTEQANAVEELTSTILGISDDTKKSADNASKAKYLSEKVQNTISVQNEEINKMLIAMDNIEKKSNEINNIIKTIDDIAFQTNILALNAAVEAARAGSAGKGFAVVADEVRNLASKSAEAAKNTTVLISASIEAVNNGSRIANVTAEKMKEVMTISEDTNKLIMEISSSAESQSNAISQVTVGIEQISQIVQQNSATAEETAASCEELSGQAKILKDQISSLKV